MNPDISVIVPCYNAERFVDKCIGSLLRNDFGNFEIVCLNDGSTDGILGLARDYAPDSFGSVDFRALLDRDLDAVGKRVGARINWRRRLSSVFRNLRFRR